MIHSMTGFGSAQKSVHGMTASVELKSVNSRYLNISFYIPPEIQDKEIAMKEMIQKGISRGKINVYLEMDKTDALQPEITINKQLAKSYKNMLDELKHTTGLEGPITLQDLIQFEEIFVTREEDEETLQTIWKACQEALGDALNGLIEMRAQEGKQLQADLRKRADAIADKMNKVQNIYEGRPEAMRDKLREKIDSLMEENNLDEERLEMEIAILVDKMDITEEIVRTQSHIKFFKEALENNEPVGRRLKFLAQELNREINTIGSKANSSEISRHIVSAKEALEQIREQIANVE
jgi:uncharacterized protein (TIGR00255 family)